RSFWNGPDGTRGPIAKRWNVSSWPTIYLLDHEGVIHAKNLRGAQLDAAIAELMVAAEAAARTR
ncbi:MAG: TlpA family protein disulfide reductase, partial [Planctomycetes bacterium]|nr:TlpA family protein disulfide reductase [Planctomycetota bacterium]